MSTRNPLPLGLRAFIAAVVLAALAIMASGCGGSSETDTPEPDVIPPPPDTLVLDPSPADSLPPSVDLDTLSIDPVPMDSIPPIDSTESPQDTTYAPPPDTSVVSDTASVVEPNTDDLSRFTRGGIVRTADSPEAFESALADARPGDAIVLRAGTYPAFTIPVDSLAIVGYPGERVQITGLMNFDADWTLGNDGIWSADYGMRLEMHESKMRPQLAARPELFVLAGQPIAPVYEMQDLEPRSYFVQGHPSNPERVYLSLPDGWNPNTLEIQYGTIGEVIKAIRHGEIDSAWMQNLLVTGGAATSKMGQIVVSGDGWLLRTVVSNYSAGTGIEIHGGIGHRLEHTETSYNGESGLWIHGENAGIRILDHTANSNNTEDFDWRWHGGGAKIEGSRDIEIDGWTAYGNNGPGLWFDINNYNGVVRNVHIARSTGKGFMCEHYNGGFLYENVKIEDTLPRIVGTSRSQGNGLQIQSHVKGNVYRNWQITGSAGKDVVIKYWENRDEDDKSENAGTGNLTFIDFVYSTAYTEGANVVGPSRFTRTEAF